MGDGWGLCKLKTWKIEEISKLIRAIENFTRINGIQEEIVGKRGKKSNFAWKKRWRKD